MTDLEVALERCSKLAGFFNECKGSKLKFRAKVIAYGMKEFGNIMLVLALLRIAMLLYTFWKEFQAKDKMPITAAMHAFKAEVLELGRLGR